MTEINRNHLMSEIKSLKLADQLQLLEEVAALIRQKTEGLNKTRNIKELQGKGKDIWKQCNIKDYLNQERSTWTG